MFGEDALVARALLDADGRVWESVADTVRATSRVDAATWEATPEARADGPAAEARLQHPLGVRTLPDGSLAIADTYNGAIRRYAPEGADAAGRPAPASVSTVARGLAEPTGGR